MNMQMSDLMISYIQIKASLMSGLAHLKRMLFLEENKMY